MSTPKQSGPALRQSFLITWRFKSQLLSGAQNIVLPFRAAREFDAAECYTSPDAAGCIAALNNVARNSERQKQLVANAHRMYQSRF